MTNGELPDEQHTADDTDLSAILTLLTDEPRVTHAILFTSDGLLLDHSAGWDRARADSTSALLASVRGSLVQIPHAAGTEGGQLEHAMVQIGARTILLLTPHPSTGLAVFVDAPTHLPPVRLALEATARRMNGLGDALAARVRAEAERRLRPQGLRA
jgi:predicted regulator of Ras-like GTPase activity (Roadblock/LC7/MglB family)